MTMELILEAERRGILPPEKKQLLDEARRRGLVKKKVLSLPSHREAEDVSMKAYEADPPKYDPPSQFSRLTKGFGSRLSTMSTGGILGTALGTPGGPVGMGAGGMLGTAAGSLIHDLGENITRRVQDRPPHPRTTGIVEPTKRALREGAEDVAFAAGIPAAGRVMKRGVGKVLGITTPEARRLAVLAEKSGVGLGAAHLSPRKAVRGLPKVFGVFPFIGTPLRKGQERVVGELDKSAADLLNTLAPSSTAFETGTNLTKAAAKRFSRFNNMASAFYKRFYDIASNLSVKEIVDTRAIKESLGDIAEKQGREAITLQTGESLKAFGTDPIGDYIKQLSDLPERITVEQARGLERQLNSIVRGAGKEGYDISRLSGLKGALEEAKATLDVSKLAPGEAEQVMGAWKKANRFFAQTRGVFETPTAKRFGKVDKNIFGKRFFKAGSVSEDEALDVFFKAGSPESLQDLRKLVGEKDFRSATRKALEKAYTRSVLPAKEGGLVGDMFSAQKFEKELALHTPEGKKMLATMLKGSGVKPDDWYDFLEVAKKATDITIRDPSTFVMRRVILGGGLAGTVALGAGKVSIPAAVAITLFARKGAGFLMNKNQLQTITRFLDPNTTELVRKGMLYRAMKAPFKED